MAERATCPISRDSDVPARHWNDRDAYTYECPRCGEFAMSWRTKEIIKDIPNSECRKATAVLRERKIHGEDWPIVTHRRFEDPNHPVMVWNDLVALFPESGSDRLERTLINLVKLSPNLGDPVLVDGYFEPVAFADNYNGVKLILEQLAKDDLIKRDGSETNRWIVTVKGWDRVSELQRGQGTRESIPDQIHFPEGKHLDIQKHVARVIRQAKKSLWIYDSYMDEKIVEELSEVPASEIRLLTQSPKALFRQRLNALKQQCPSKTIEAKSCGLSHDRYYVIDEGQVWTLGTSYNQAGSKATLLSKITVNSEEKKIIESFKDWWQGAEKEL